ncbi:MAG: hypothetical protein WC787_03875 [Patescibacteria group bacterium]|jgi:hypothetical protein
MNTIRWGLIFGLYVVALGFGVATISLIYPGGLGAFMRAPNVDAYLVFPLLVIPMLLAFVPFLTRGIKNSRTKKHLMDVGQKTTATILAIRDTGLTVNNHPYIEVSVQLKSGVETSFQLLVSRVAIPRVGDQIDVLYDPADPTVVMPVNS